jgi:hypothetical protein
MYPLYFVIRIDAKSEQTREFNDKELWPEDGSQPFVWSTDDSYVSLKRNSFSDIN